MRLAGIRNTSLFDGEGINMVVFFQGCSVHCPGCHNPGTWNFDGGVEVPFDIVTEHIEKYLDFIDGITLSGGNPVESWEDAYALAKWAKEHHLLVTLYSGWTMEMLMEKNKEAEHKLLSYVNTVIDSPFVAEQKADLPFRGSSNQHIWDNIGGYWYRKE